jgi:hypothetical protein
MVQIVGSYKLERNENLDEFYQSIGVPWFARKMMGASSPTMFVAKDEEECWNFKTVTFMRTSENSFKLDEEYEETLPNGKLLESITTMDGENKFVTKSKSTEEGDDFNFERHYEFNDDGMVMTLQSSSAEKPAKRYFKRLQ